MLYFVVAMAAAGFIALLMVLDSEVSKKKNWALNKGSFVFKLVRTEFANFTPPIIDRNKIRR